jgi:hypothetical protein
MGKELQTGVMKNHCGRWEAFLNGCVVAFAGPSTPERDRVRSTDLGDGPHELGEIFSVACGVIERVQARIHGGLRQGNTA